jgi:hypothetical protein
MKGENERKRERERRKNVQCRERERERENKIFTKWRIDKESPVFHDVCIIIVKRLPSFNFYRRAWEKEDGKEGAPSISLNVRGANTLKVR